MNVSEVSAVLKEGMVVNTRIGLNQIWYLNIIYKLDRNHVYLKLTDAFIQNMLLKDSHVVIKHSLESFEYLFEGTISEIGLDDPCHVIVKINKCIEVVNHRFFPRHDVYLASSVQPEWSEEPIFCVVNNLSLGGMGFVSKKDIDYGEESTVQISLQPGIKAQCRGKIITKRVKSNYIEYCMQFTHMTEENSHCLSNYLQLYEDSVNLLKQHFIDDIKGKL